MIAFLEERLVVVREKLEAIRTVETYISEKIDRYREELRTGV